MDEQMKAASKGGDTVALIEELKNRLEDFEIDRDMAMTDVSSQASKIEKAEARRDKVKPEIFEKVVGEYRAAKTAAEAKVAEIDEKMAQAKKELEAAEIKLVEDKKAEEERIRQEALRAEEQKRRQEEEARKAEEDRLRKEEDARRAEEEKLRREEEERKAAEEQKRKEEDARRAEEERKLKEEEARKADQDRLKKEEEAHRKAEAERENVLRQLADLAKEKAYIDGEMASPQNELEELEFRNEMGEFSSEEEFQAAGALIKEKLAGLKERLEEIDLEIEELQTTANALAATLGIEPTAAAVPAEPAAKPAEVVEAPKAAPAAEVPPPPAPAAAEKPAESEWDEEEIFEPEEEAADVGGLLKETPAAPSAEQPAAKGDDWSEMEKEFFMEPGDNFIANPCLVMQDSSGQEKVFDLVSETILIGSAGIGEVDINIPHKSVDKKHARIKLEHGRYMIKDLHSRNGTFINGKRIKKDRLNHLDKLKVGDIFFQVRLL
jgi:hypothetical protein